MTSINDRYVEFAAGISFLEFRHEEFGPPVIDVASYDQVIRGLQSRTDWDIDSLSNYLLENPTSLAVFEALFRDQRFSNAQLCHFFFDVERLNSRKLDSAYEYAVLNLLHDHSLYEMCQRKAKELAPDTDLTALLRMQTDEGKRCVTAAFKMAVSEYSVWIPEDDDALRTRIALPEFRDSSIRISNYLLTRLRLNQLLSSVQLKEYLSFKRRPRDIKGLHGKFCTESVVEILNDAGYQCIDAVLKQKKINILKNDIRSQLGEDMPSGLAYCTEKQVEGVTKSKSGGLKKFDAILISDGRPKHLFEVNFYTTSGTKIGINEDEYIDLNSMIRADTKYHFHWITDGNYWLSKDGRQRFERLVERFGAIYNINSFAASLDSFR